MNVENICLITPIDQNKNILCWDGNLRKRYFEDECLKMIKYWRKYAGWLKNINIYVYNVNGANISLATIDKLSQYGCIYNTIENNLYSDMGFLTEPLCGKLAEEQVKEDVLIKIDLDMCITRPLEKYLIEESEKYTLIEQYSDYDAKY
jgi:hypothetical protein